MLVAEGGALVLTSTAAISCCHSYEISSDMHPTRRTRIHPKGLQSPLEGRVSHRDRGVNKGSICRYNMLDNLLKASPLWRGGKEERGGEGARGGDAKGRGSVKVLSFGVSSSSTGERLIGAKCVAGVFCELLRLTRPERQGDTHS